MTKPLFALFLMVLAALPLSAQQIDARNPASVVAALQNLGYRASLTTDSDGDPMIESAAHGVVFTIFFYGCSSGANCLDIQFASSFDKEGATTPRQISNWNEEMLVGKAALNARGNPDIRHFVAGAIEMSPAAFDRLMRRWDAALSAFLAHIDW